MATGMEDREIKDAHLSSPTQEMLSKLFLTKNCHGYHPMTRLGTHFRCSVSSVISLQWSAFYLETLLEKNWICLQWCTGNTYCTHSAVIWYITQWLHPTTSVDVLSSPCPKITPRCWRDVKGQEKSLSYYLIRECCRTSGVVFVFRLYSE